MNLIVYCCLNILFMGILCLGQRTNFINHESKIHTFAEQQWFIDNIPFIDIPHKEIEEIYYYRFSTLKRHLRYTIPGSGYTVTEFVHRVGYSQKFDTIVAAAGHHIYEARWLRNRRYVQDYINFWTRIGGNPQQYSEWIADAAYQSFLVDGDAEFILSQQEGLVRNFNGWDDHFEPTWNLYWISPEWDAQEYSCASVQTSDPYHGGVGYRPSFNAEMYGNAIAISKIALMNNDQETAQLFQNKANSIRDAMINRLWDSERNFFYHAFRDDNTGYSLLDSREEIGFYPWLWHVVPNDTKFSVAWDQLFDTEGFDTEYGPATCEVRSQWYDGNQISQCCWWNGNSWPYSTSLTLSALAAQVRDYANSATVTVNKYFRMLEKYAFTQYKDDKPYVAECHSPDKKIWVCDGFNHSEHYAHSTYADNVLSGLLGIVPQADNVFEINPLVPNDWTFFAVENLPYHGHEITVLYDSDGTYYKSGHSGLQIFINGEFAKSQSNVGRMFVPIPSPVVNNVKLNKIENYAANPNSENYPAPVVSYNSPFASEWHPLDGRIIYDYNPTNRWTNYGSGTPTDWYAVNFGPGRAKIVSQVKLYVYSDVVTLEGGVDCPKKMVVEVYDGAGWKVADNQISIPEICSPNDVNIISFNPVSTEMIRVVFTRDIENDHYVGLTEFEVWAPWPQVAEKDTYEAEDGLVTRAHIVSTKTASGGSFVSQHVTDQSSVEITGIWVDRPGLYSINIYYANGLQQPATHKLTVNNDREIQVIYEPTHGWGIFESFVTVPVNLLRGNNALLISKGDNVLEFDRIQIVDESDDTTNRGERTAVMSTVKSIVVLTILLCIWQ